MIPLNIDRTHQALSESEANALLNRFLKGQNKLLELAYLAGCSEMARKGSWEKVARRTLRVVASVLGGSCMRIDGGPREYVLSVCPLADGRISPIRFEVNKRRGFQHRCTRLELSRHYAIRVMQGYRARSLASTSNALLDAIAFPVKWTSENLGGRDDFWVVDIDGASLIKRDTGEPVAVTYLPRSSWDDGRERVWLKGLEGANSIAATPYKVLAREEAA